MGLSDYVRLEDSQGYQVDYLGFIILNYDCQHADETHTRKLDIKHI